MRRETPQQVFQRLLAEREAATRREFTATPDGSFDAAIDALDREAESEHEKQDRSILLSGAGQTKDAERVGGHRI